VKLVKRVVLGFKKMEKIKNNFNTLLLIILIIVVLLLSWKINLIKNNNQEVENDLKKSIIQNDKIVKEADGRYSKLIDYYNTENDLKESLKNSNEELYRTLKKQNTQILSLTSVVISLKDSISKGFGTFNKKDSNLIDLDIKYPEDKNPFIIWKGTVDKRTAFYNGNWVFGKMPIQIILSEDKRGLWKTTVNGPEWFKMDSIKIISLPPDEYSQNELKRLQFFVGGGYIKSLSNIPNSISIGGGLSIDGKHNIIVNATTNNQLGVSYFYNFQTKKKNK
jgi:predicted RND superfamily exporter protein